MAVEVFPDSPMMGLSPRISFSHDLKPNDIPPIHQYIQSTNSSATDFDFCFFRGTFDQDSSSADELFFDGKILPFQVRKSPPPPPPPPKAAPEPPPPPPPSPQHLQSRTSSCKDTPTTTAEATIGIPELEEKQLRCGGNKSSFWPFKRSTSLNCGTSYGRGLCSLPLLSRSNSTGSSANVKRTGNCNLKQGLMKSSSSSHQKPPLKKSINAAYYCNGVKIHPVLNVPPANLFGLGTIFSGGKAKSKKK